MLEPHQSMWDGHLGEITATQHRIDLIPGAKPVHSQPYRAGTRAREIEKAEIEKMLAQWVIEPATCEWASPHRNGPETRRVATLLRWLPKAECYHGPG
jgi:hypothetical protein